MKTEDCKRYTSIPWPKHGKSILSSITLSIDGRRAGSELWMELKLITTNIFLVFDRLRHTHTKNRYAKFRRICTMMLSHTAWTISSRLSHRLPRFVIESSLLIIISANFIGTSIMFSHFVSGCSTATKLTFKVKQRLTKRRFEFRTKFA